MSRENHIYEPDWSGRTDQLCSVNKPVIKKDALALAKKENERSKCKSGKAAALFQKQENPGRKQNPEKAGV